MFSCHLAADLYKQKDKGINLVVSRSVDNRWNPILVQNIELHPELFFNSVEINKLDSKKEITLLRGIDAELINETLLISLLCRAEKL